MQPLQPVVLEGYGVRLEPMHADHAQALADAASDGELWKLWYTSVPAPHEAPQYIATALDGMHDGHMMPWVVRDVASDSIVGSTRYHDIVTSARRVEIGYTWYASRMQRTHVNPACKMLLLQHAFDTVGCGVVGFKTDRFNTRSQRAIEALGAQRDGVIRQHHARRDGSVRDSVVYSIVYAEWPDVRCALLARLG